MICPRCKHKIVEGTLFCGHCGGHLKVLLEPLSGMISNVLEVAQTEQGSQMDSSPLKEDPQNHKGNNRKENL